MALVGREQLDHPALGAVGGATLHTSINTIYTNISDDMPGRYKTYSGIANSAANTYTHNFGVPFADIRVRIYTGTFPNLVRVQDPVASGWVIAAGGTPQTQISVTAPSSGGPHTFAVVVHHVPSAEKLDELTDVDLTVVAEDGQALVYNAGTLSWKPGASGDSSMKLSSVSGNSLILKGGFMSLTDGREIGTWDGAGTTEADYGTDLTLNLDTILGSTPANATTYYLYIDLTNLGAAVVLTDSGRSVHSIETANQGLKFKLLTTLPSAVNHTSYRVLGFLRSATTGNSWSATGSLFRTWGSKLHDNGPAWTETVDDAEDGQALVYDAALAKYKPGASGDSSFKLQSVAVDVATVKAGSIFLDDGKELYLAADVTFNLKTGVNSLGVTAPAASTAYYVYLDLAFLPAQTSVGSADRKVYAITSGTSGQFVVLAATPTTADLSRYVPLYAVKTDGSSNYVTTVFSNLAFRRHQKMSVAVSPLIYEDADHSIGTVGSSGQLATYGALGTADAPTPSTAHVYSLNNSLLDANGTPLSLTNAGAVSFSRVGFFGRETVAGFGGTSTDYLSSASATYNVGNVALTYGGWFMVNSLVANRVLMGNFDGTTGWMIYATTGGNFTHYAAGVSTDTGVKVPLGSWFHVAVTYATSGTVHTFYINGQKAYTTTGTLSSPGAFFKIGARGSAAAEFLVGAAQDVFVFFDTLTDAQVNNIYSKRFKGQQLAGGHVLQTDSFPLSSLANKALVYPLSSESDVSGNTRTLSNLNTTPFTGLGLFGAADCAQLNGTNQGFSLVDSWLNMNPSVQDWAIGGWFSANDWTATAHRTFFGSSGDGIFAYLTSAGGIEIQQVGGTHITSTINTTFVDGSWHHICIVSGGGVFKFYVDGILQESKVKNLTVTTLTHIKIGIYSDGTSNPFAGRISNVFFVKDYLLTDSDIRKLYSARVDLTGNAASIIAGSQIWGGNLLSEDGLQLSDLSGQSFIVDKSPAGKVWMDFGGATTSDPATRVNLKLYDGGLGATTVPVRKFQRSFTAAITDGTTIAHGLPSAPNNFSIVHNSAADGKYKPLDAEGYIRADGTNIYLDGFGALTIDATKDLIVIASCGVPAIGIDLTTLANQVRYTTVKTAAYNAATWDKVLTDSSAGAFTVTLPATPAVGDTVEVYDGTESWATFNVTLGKNGSFINSLNADYVLNVAGKMVKAVYISSAQGWRIYA